MNYSKLKWAVIGGVVALTGSYLGNCLVNHFYRAPQIERLGDETRIVQRKGDWTDSFKRRNETSLSENINTVDWYLDNNRRLRIAEINQENRPDRILEFEYYGLSLAINYKDGTVQTFEVNHRVVKEPEFYKTLLDLGERKFQRNKSLTNILKEEK